MFLTHIYVEECVGAYALSVLHLGGSVRFHACLQFKPAYVKLLTIACTPKHLKAFW